ncbi:undecaprenyl/decaprenyl-phosphate alpha-N-acetylglucosaminyl 1-phosphate transferase [Patescibacteria group bacterium]|nr:undecaprenyl/decaprenyl-phosphate alpha-N-acetylglucosaminyl 1-phosphate transferase [Patescibacteria group bacterium]
MNFLYIPCVAFFLAIIFVFLSKKLAKRFHIYDNPGSILAVHEHPVPHLGGVGIFLAVFMALTLSFFLIFKQVSIVRLSSVLIGGLLAFSLGLWDDLNWKRIRKNYRPNAKFILQVVVSGVVSIVLVMGGLSIRFIPIGIAGMLLVIFYIFGGMNAVNMQDGLDGLAAGLAAISAVGFAGLSFLTGNTLGLILSLSTLGAVLGFLMYNFPPASIFMGDSGSHFLGFVVVALAIIFTSRPYDLRWSIGPILIIGLPVFDAAWAVGRRFLQRKKLFQGDRGHFYDRMVQKDISVRRTVLMCWLIQVGFVVGGVSLTQL